MDRYHLEVQVRKRIRELQHTRYLELPRSTYCASESRHSECSERARNKGIPPYTTAARQDELCKCSCHPVGADIIPSDLLLEVALLVARIQLIRPHLAMLTDSEQSIFVSLMIDLGVVIQED